MKKIIYLLFLAPSTLKAQIPSIPATTLYVDAAYMYSPSSDQMDLENGYFYVNPFFSQTFGKGHVGYFVEGWVDKDVLGLSPGIMFVGEGAHTYHEGGIGYGVEVPYSGGNAMSYLNSYYWFENKSDEFHARNKLIVNLNYAFYPSDQYSWWLTSITFFPFKNVGIGFQASTPITGGRLQIGLPGEKLNKNIWLVVGENRYALGATFARTWFKKLKARN